MRIVVLGAGMAGAGATHRLHAAGVRPSMFEMRAHPGGHTATYIHDGFVFDDGPHISFTTDPRIQELFAHNVNGEFETLRARVNNYWQGYWIKHPAQCNLYGLPPALVTDILADMSAASHAPPVAPSNYAEWLVATYGETFARTFPMEYGLKYHTSPADRMTTDWLGPRMYRPDFREVLAGALLPSTPEVHYVSQFRYPTRNGFVSYLQPFLRQADLHLNHRLVALDPQNRTAAFSNGVTVRFDGVISSIPLPELVPTIVGVPERVLEAARQLACTTCVMVNIGIDRDDISPAHWTYFYDRDFCFTRLSFPHMFSRWNAPAGAGSIQAELYFSAKYRPLETAPTDFVAPVISDLKRCGLLRDSDRLLHTGVTVSAYANVIFDLERADALRTVHAYLDEVGVAYCGRYGEWGYHWTDDAFISGERAAEATLARHTDTPRHYAAAST